MSVTTWTDSPEGYRTKTIKRGNVTVKIYRPILTDEERAKREGQVVNTLSRCKSLASN